jgi:caffeoyl-CoA O-methyltransferase
VEGMRYEDVQEYVARLVGDGDDLLAWTYKESSRLREQGVHPITSTSGRFLELLARSHSARNVLEIGSGAGYSALWLMKGMSEDGTIDTIEQNPEAVKAIESVARKSRHGGRMRIHHGRALSVLKHFHGPYDLIFIDADKREYPEYLKQALRLSHLGSVIVADNMFWHGAAIRGEGEEEGTRGIIEYTERIFHDPRLSSLIVPLGDGMAVSSRIR